MNKAFSIPAVLINARDNCTEVVAGLELASIMSAEIISGPLENVNERNKIDAGKQYFDQKSFVQVLTTWPKSCVLELHWTAIPNLENSSLGVVWISLFLRSQAKSHQTALNEVLQGYFRLRPLLETHFRHLSFSPITEQEVLKMRYHPFEPKGAVAIERIQEKIALSSPIQQTHMGFGAAKQSKIEAETVTHIYPWLPVPNSEDLLPRGLLAQIDPIQLVVRLRPGELKKKYFESIANTIETCEHFLSAGMGNQITLTSQANLIRDISLIQLARLNESVLDAGVFFLSPSTLDVAVVNALAPLFMSTVATAYNSKMFFQGGYSIKSVQVEKALSINYFPESPITTAEAASVFYLPLPPAGEISGLPVRNWRTAPARMKISHEQSKEMTILFDNDHQGHIQEISITNENRMRHSFILGQTGSGKSHLMEQMIIQDMQNGHGIMVVDPHGDMVESLLGRIPASRTEDVILFDVLDIKMPIGFNLLEWDTLEERDLIIDELYHCFDLIYDMKLTGGPIFEYNFRNMLSLLVSDGNGNREGFRPTILDFIRCYTDDDFRKWLTETSDDQETTDFIDELENTRGDAALHNLAPYVTSKLGRFTSDLTLKRIFGQEKTGFSFEEILNQKKILLVKMGRGRVGSVVSSLLATQLLLRLKLAAMKRGELAANQRKDFFLYIDEAGLIPSHSLGDILSEARKFRLGLTLASQYTRQLSSSVSTDRKDTLLDAVFGNVSTYITFRLGKEDAKEMAGLFWPEFSQMDILRLPNYCGYAKVHLNNQPTPAFSFKTRFINTEPSKDQAKQIRAQSQFLYGTPADEVDERTRERRNAWKK